MNSKRLSGRIIISLDQCFLSRLAIKQKRDAGFAELLQALLTGLNRGRIVCPAHALETKYESIKMRDAGSTRKLVKLQNTLSLGFAFRPFDDLVACRMLQMARPSFAFHDFDYAPIRLECGQALQLKRAILEKLDQKCQVAADAQPYPPKNYAKGSAFKSILATLEAEREWSMRTVLRFIAKTGVPPNPKGLVDWTVGVGECLLRHGVTATECEGALRAVDDGRWRQIDALRVNSILFGKIEQGMLESGRRWKLSDHPDVLKLSVALLHAGVATCDAPMRDVIRQTKLGQEVPAKVFAVTEPTALTNYIRSV